MNSRAAGHRFPKSLRLLRRAEFRQVYEEGRRRSNSLCTMFFRPNQRAETRLGITTPSRLGKAVTRNRIKRRLRELFRQEYSELPKGVDIVLNPRPAAATVPFQVLQRETLKLLCQAAPGQSPAGPNGPSDSRRSP
jgi:ribonuclease P protein component